MQPLGNSIDDSIKRLQRWINGIEAGFIKSDVKKVLDHIGVKHD